MLFWVILSVFIVLTVLSVIMDWEYVGALSVVFGVMTLIVMLTIMGCNCIGSSATRIKMMETQRALKYKLESGSCRDELGLLNKEVIDEIQIWNEEISRKKVLQRDIWVGVFVPNIYDEFELIDYEGFVPKDRVEPIENIGE